MLRTCDAYLLTATCMPTVISLISSQLCDARQVAISRSTSLCAGEGQGGGRLPTKGVACGLFPPHPGPLPPGEREQPSFPARRDQEEALLQREHANPHFKRTHDRCMGLPALVERRRQGRDGNVEPDTIFVRIDNFVSSGFLVARLCGPGWRRGVKANQGWA